MTSGSKRPTWPYTIGALGAASLGLSTLLMVFTMTSRSGDGKTGDYALMIVGISAAMLGAGWLGMLKAKHGNVGAMLASFGVAGAILFTYVNRDNFEMMRVSGVLLILSFVAFAVAHVFVARLPIVRIAAGISGVALLPQVAAIAGVISLGGGADTLLAMIGLGGLGVTCLLLAAGMMTLKSAADLEPDQL
jgi:hypothetical protein